MKTARRKIILILCSLIFAVTALLTAYFVLSSVGVIQTNKIKIIIEAQSEQKIYDGTPLVGEAYEITYGQIRPDHNIEIVFIGSQTQVGESPLSMEIIITDFNGADASKYYDVIAVEATLTVTKQNIVVATGTDTKFFDGEPLKNDQFEILEGNLLQGHTLSCISVTQITEVGSVDNVLKPKIVDENQETVTDNYEIDMVCGKLTVEPRVIKIVTSDAKKRYDATALVSPDYTLAEGNIIDSHNLVVTVDGTQTEVGTSQNVATVQVFDIENNDVTAYYDIEILTGQLTVEKIELLIYSDSIAKTYDGSPVFCDSFSQPQNLLTGDIFYGVLDVSITDCGEVENTFSQAYVLNSLGENVDNHYEFIFKPGKITVLKREIVLETHSASKVYDGTPLTYNDKTYSDAYAVSGAFAPNESAVVDVYGTITPVGEVENSAFIKVIRTVNGESVDVSGNYNVTTRYGTLTVLATKSVIYFKTESASKVYDGTALQTNPNNIQIIDSSALNNNHSIDLNSLQTTAVLNVGTYENRAEFNVYNDISGMDVSNSYADGYRQKTDLGWLTIIARELTFTPVSQYVEHSASSGQELLLSWQVVGLCNTDVIDALSVKFEDTTLNAAILGVTIEGDVITMRLDSTKMNNFRGELSLDVETVSITNTVYNQKVTENYAISSDMMTLAIVK